MTGVLVGGAVVSAAAVAAAALATATAARAAVRGVGRSRQSWAWLAAGTGAWALGEAWWMVEGLLRGSAGLAASPADAGHLLLVPCVMTGLLLHPSTAAIRRGLRVRLALDIIGVTLALLVLAWQFPITGAWRRAGSVLGGLVAVGYPVTDVLLVAVVATLAVYGAHRPRGHPPWLVVGLLSLGAADTGHWYAEAGVPGQGPAAAGALRIGGFAAVAFAAAAGRADAGGGPRTSPRSEALPYAVVAATGLAVLGQRLAGLRISTVPVVMLVVLVVLTYVRQYLVLHENHRLHVAVDDGQERLHRSATRDALTGLPNRAGLLELLEQELGGERERPLSLVKLRPSRPALLDNLEMSDSDAALAEFARRIGDCLRPGDRLARIAEATFVVLVGGGVETAVGVAYEIMLAAETPLHVAGRRLHLPLAAGVAEVPSGAEPGVPAAVLVQQAAIALNAITASPGDVAVFTPQMLVEHAAAFELEQIVVQSLRRKPAAVDVRFEPVVELASGRLTGVAVRARWNGGRHGTLGTGQLIAVARAAGVASRVDDTVVAVAVDAFAEWSARWPDERRELWLTVCAETLSDPGFPDRLLGRLAAASLPARQLVLDLLDGTAEQPFGEVGRLAVQRLRATGVRITTGDALTISERSGNTCVDYFDVSPLLVARCVDDLRARRLVQATVEFAATCDAVTAARQVTTVDQHEELRSLGCTVARGPLYGAPLPRDESGALIGAAAAGTWQSPVSREATRRRSSQAWQELRNVINHLPIAAFACDGDGDVILAEGGLLDSAGGGGTLLGRPIVTLIGDGRDSDGEFDEALRSALDGEPAVATVAIGGRWLRVHLYPECGGGGGAAGALGVAVDVTHQFRAEQAVRGSEQRFRAVFTQAPIGMMIVGPDARIVQANPTLAAMLGYEPSDLTGRGLATLWHPDSPPDTAERYEGIRAGSTGGYLAERAYRHRDGSPVWARVSVAPLSGQSAVGSVVELVEDLRPVKQLEVELRHAQKLEAVGMLAAGIAHEINTPIQFIGDNINFLSDAFGHFNRVLTTTLRHIDPHAEDAANAELAGLIDEVDLPWLLEEVPSAAAQSLEGVARVATIVRAMRNFGHPDQGDPAPVDVNAAIRDTATVARNEYKYVADLVLELGDVPAVLGFPSEFHQVVLNLIVNAAHAIADAANGPERRGTITVRSWSDGDAVFVSVADDGCGMSAETRGRIFEPFFTTKEVGRGTGQGLTIVYNVVVEKHGGTVEVDSAPGRGAVFTVRLPLRATRD